MELPCILVPNLHEDVDSLIRNWVARSTVGELSKHARCLLPIVKLVCEEQAGYTNVKWAQVTVDYNSPPWCIISTFPAVGHLSSLSRRLTPQQAEAVFVDLKLRLFFNIL